MNSSDKRKQGVVSSDLKKLDNFVKALKTSYVVDVGIMGKKNSRDDESGMTNAEVGFQNEFGVGSIPIRSFLRMPLFLKSEEIVERVAKTNPLAMLAKGDIIGVMTNLGLAAEAVIAEAFESHGFGTWAPDSPRTIRAKHSSAPLIDSGQLRRSIASVVHPA